MLVDVIVHALDWLRAPPLSPHREPTDPTSITGGWLCAGVGRQRRVSRAPVRWQRGLLHYWGALDLPAPYTKGEAMASKDLTRLASEILQLESETFEVSDYAETNDLFLISSTTSSTTSTTSCSA
jgi:thiazolylpeptide-type bacteriocin precursor